MDIGLGWLSDMMRALAKLLPRLIHVDKTQEGVMFWLSHARRIGPGVHVYWPIVMRPMVHPVVRDTLNLPPQTLPYGNKEPLGLTISVTVVYTIDDILKALAQTYDFMVTIRDRAQAGVVPVVIGRTVDELVDKYQRINSAITKRIRKDLAPFGVRVETAFMSDFHLTAMYRVLGQTSILPVAIQSEVEEDPIE